MLLFALGVSLATGILFGLAPAWQASRTTIGSVLKEGGRSSTASSGRWVRNGLLVAEVAMSIVLLVGAALLLRSFARLTNVDPGFRPEHVLAFRVALPDTAYPENHHRIAFFDKLLDGLEALPEVTPAGMTQTLPMRGDYILSFTIQGQPAPKPNEGPSANYRVASPNYFQALGIPLLRGRDVHRCAMERSRPRSRSSIRSSSTALPGPRSDWPGHRHRQRHRRLLRDRRRGRQHPRRQPRGESGADDVRARSTQNPFGAMWVVARTTGDPSALVAPVRQTVQGIDQALPAFAMTPLATVVSDSVAQRRFSMLLLGVFASIALFLAAVGLYGVVAYTVSQRTQEIGLRMAIGAQRGDVLRMVVGGGMKLALVGVAIGIACALALARLVATMLFEVTPFDPASYSATALVLLAVAALACYVPARRATRVDPIVALRQE